MNRHFHRISLILGVLLLLGAAVANAQSNSRMVADIPFDFHVGPATLTSGTYWVIRTGFAGIFAIQARDGNRGVFAATHPGVANKEYGIGKLVFNRYGKDYFLYEVQDPYDYMTSCLPKSKLEKEIARNVNGGSQPVVVAMEKK